MAGSSRKVAVTNAFKNDVPMMEPIGICFVCAHREKPYPPTCAAFPDGIPDEILVGNFNHTNPYPGDNGIQFQKKGQ